MFRGWIVVLFSFCTTLTFGISYSYSDFFLPLQQQFNWNAVTNSTVPAVSLIVFSLGALLCGYLMNRVGTSRISLVGALLVGSGLILSSQISDYYELLLLYGVLTSLGSAFVVTVGTSLAVRWFHKGRGLAVGIAASGSGVGTLAVPPAVEFILVRFGWRASFLSMGIFFLITLVVASSFLKSPEELSISPLGWNEMSTEERGLVKNFTFRETLSTVRYWMIYAMFLLCTFGSALFIVHAAPFGKTHGLDPVTASLALGILGAGSLASRVIFGVISDRIPRAVTLIFALCSELIGLAVLPFIGGSVLLFLACSFAIGLGYGGYLTDIIALIGDLFGARSIGSNLGMVETGFGIGGLIGPIAGGAYFSQFQNYTGVLQISALLVVVALVISFLFARQVRHVERFPKVN